MRKHYNAIYKAEIAKELLKEEKTLGQLASETGIHPTQLKEWKKIAMNGLPELFSRSGQALDKLVQAHTEQVNELYAEIGRLTTQVNWLKKNLASNLSRPERLGLVERGAEGVPMELPLRTQAELLGLNRSSLYYQPVLPSMQEVVIKHRIDEIYTELPFYGSRRITAQLGREGMVINRKAVQRHMREMGIAGISPGPNVSKPSQEHPVYPYLLRNVTSSYPNHVWGIDITYIRLQKSWMYLVAVLDWYSRYVLSWQLDDSLEIDFVLAAVDAALVQNRPVIWNSDQGSHFTSPHYTQRLLDASVQISMDGKGRALDNIFSERFWRSVKYEEVYLHEYLTPRDAFHGLGDYFDFYNQRRLHQSLGYRTPAEVYFGP